MARREAADARRAGPIGDYGSPSPERRAPLRPGPVLETLSGVSVSPREASGTSERKPFPQWLDHRRGQNFDSGKC